MLVLRCCVVYCALRIPAHLRCTECSILLHLMDICFPTCSCLWQISQIQTRLFKVIGRGLVSTSPAFVSSSASHPAGPHAQNTVNRAPIAGGGKVRHNLQFFISLFCRTATCTLLLWSHHHLYHHKINTSQTYPSHPGPTQNK